MFVFDTNAIIYYLAGREAMVRFVYEQRDALFFVPAIVAAEFFSYPLLDGVTRSLFGKFLNDVVVVNLDLEVAQRAGHLRTRYGVKLLDAIVAASVLITGSVLITYNTADFQRIPDLHILSP